MKKFYILLTLIAVLAICFYQYGRATWHPLVVKVMGKKTVSEVIDEYGPDARNKLKPIFNQKGVFYPPPKLSFVAFKDTDTLEVWAANDNESYTLITSYPVKAASGELGPKLEEGDRQVPEGIYKIVGFNPNSAYHLSMKLNYPNEFDTYHANHEGRTEPGTNIFIHGKASSIGCLAMGDEAIEELFTLVHDAGRSKTTVLISPTNPSLNSLEIPVDAPEWTAELYRQIESKYRAINPLKG
ncbi:hypothetical protein FE810_15805 [Thalassotalea litorea]|uniref:L,D-TPase catalytic domain-containing protein n=1 Tax=Thalassotalea litorea TaxID=2020715 RepID=A0A5R9IFU2_9GAMM|nr:L,D-transpeptidase family protein [Thalassotalea litorea]TLU61048.1 hypothetical protein FE810_15805 [Thalassotalea litorea]